MQTLIVARMQLNAPILIIWIDQNINSQENLIYLSKLGYQPMNEYQQTHRELIPDNANSSNEVHPCFNVESALKILTNKSYKFRETIVIVSGRLFVSFVEAFQYNIKKLLLLYQKSSFLLHLKNRFLFLLIFNIKNFTIMAVYILYSKK